MLTSESESVVLIDAQNGDRYTNKYTLKYECVAVQDRYRHIYMHFNLSLGVVYNTHTNSVSEILWLYERNWLLLCL